MYLVDSVVAALAVGAERGEDSNVDSDVTLNIFSSPIELEHRNLVAVHASAMGYP